MTSQNDTSPKTRLVIDTDVGTDDAVAIMMAIANDDVVIEGITAVAGNTTVDNVCKNIRKVLQLCHRGDIPVYRGGSEALMKTHYKNHHQAYGIDGFNDVKDDVKSDDVIQYGHAANFLTEIVNRYPKQIVLLCIGPLTNVALAMKLDPKFGENLKGCQIMGGTYRGQGNITASAEFNFHFDPEAASITLNFLKCPTTILCWEVCADHPISMEQYDKIFGGGGPVRQFIRKREHKQVDWARKHGKPYLFADEFAMAVLLDRRMAAELFQAAADVETHGGLTKGAMIVKRHLHENDHPVAIVMKMKMEKFLEYLTYTLDKLDHRVAELNASQAQTNHVPQRKLSKTLSQYLPSPVSSSSSSK